MGEAKGDFGREPVQGGTLEGLAMTARCIAVLLAEAIDSDRRDDLLALAIEDLERLADDLDARARADARGRSDSGARDGGPAGRGESPSPERGRTNGGGGSRHGR